MIFYGWSLASKMLHQKGESPAQTGLSIATESHAGASTKERRKHG